MRIVDEERRKSGAALPWVDVVAFARRALDMAIADHDAAHGLTFFDRGVIDAAVAVRASGGIYPTAATARYRYACLFFAPPWPGIYVQDNDRRHTYEKALADHDQVRQAYIDAQYTPIDLPLATVSARADFVTEQLREIRR
jgi:predicted ATPase